MGISYVIGIRTLRKNLKDKILKFSFNLIHTFTYLLLVAKINTFSYLALKVLSVTNNMESLFTLVLYF